MLIDAQYVDDTGAALGSVVGASTIPNGAFGVVVDARTDWQPFLLGVIGITDWVASTSATAKTPGQSVGGGVLPIGIEDDTFDGLVECPLTSLDDCIDQNLTSGHAQHPRWLRLAEVRTRARRQVRLGQQPGHGR